MFDRVLHRPLLDVIEFRSSRPEVFCKKGVLRKFTEFAGKHLCQSPFFNKSAGLKPATLLKMRLWHRCFPVNFVKLKLECLRTPFYIEYLRWLLLRVVLSFFYFDKQILCLFIYTKYLIQATFLVFNKVPEQAYKRIALLTRKSFKKSFIYLQIRT